MVSRRLIAILPVALLATPWLWPFAGGPTPAVMPWLASVACACVFGLSWVWGGLKVEGVIARAWLLAALLSSVLGLLQYFGAADGLQPWVSMTKVGEAFANLRQRNQFATLTNLGLSVLLWGPVALARGSLAAAQQPRSNWCAPGWLTLAMAALLALGNASSSSRTGAVQLALLVAFALMWAGPRQRAVWSVLGAAVTTYAISVFMLPYLLGLNPFWDGIAGRFQGEGIACGSRRILWSNVLHLIAQKPWWGWGWGELDYAHFLAEYDGPRFCQILDNAHNLPLHLAVELGIPLAFGVCTLGLYLVWRSRPWREQDATRRMAWAVLALILLHSMLEYPLWYGPFQLASALSIALLLRARTPRSPATVGADAGMSGQWRLAASLLALLGLFATAYAAWDYWRVSQIYVAPEARARAYRSDTLEKISDSWLFANQVRFAELATTDLTAGNAARVAALSEELLHFSPESSVVEKRIESALLLGHEEEAQSYIARYKSMFPKDYAKWAHLRLLSDPVNPVQNGPQAP